MNCLRFLYPLTFRNTQIVARPDRLKSKLLYPAFTYYAADGWSLVSYATLRRYLTSQSSDGRWSLLCTRTINYYRRDGMSSVSDGKVSDSVKPQTKTKKPMPEGPSDMKAKSEVKVKDKSSVKVRQLTLRSNIASHDFDVKMSHVCDWLSKGDEVKVIVVKGSGSAKLQGLNTSLFDKVLNATQNIATVRLASKTESDLVINLASKKSAETSTQCDRSEKVPKPFTATELKMMRDAKTTSNEESSSNKSNKSYTAINRTPE
jgi:hypothetical protein